MLDKFEEVRSQAREALQNAGTFEELEEARVLYLGRKGALSLILRGLKDLPPQERRVLGVSANQFKREFEENLEKKIQILTGSHAAARTEKERLDVTRPGIKRERGHLHPITKVLRQVEDIFSRMGFTVAEGPEIETEYYNFDALNIPRDHPARDMWDTFWLKSQKVSSSQQPAASQKLEAGGWKLSESQRLLLRTHTSPVQIRYMEKHQPPIRIISPGIVYRYEATDASHDIEFWQIEGLMVDRDISAANFKAVIERFFSELFGKKITIRLRPSYFPFVEPGFEVDVSCMQCSGKGCSVCGQSGWLEMMGAGMVHPQVLKNVGYNPKNIQGFAFGMGLDRIVMMKYKIPDIRLMRSGDLRFLSQF